MSIKLQCDSCEAKLSVRSDKIGQTLKCPSCKHPILVQTPPEHVHISTNGIDDADDPGADDGSDGYDFTNDFDLEGLLPEPGSSTDDFSRMPPARKSKSRNKREQSKPAGSTVQSARPGAKKSCTVCQKQLDPGVRYCSGCGHNNFDAEALAIDTQMKMHSRLERLTASLGLARLLKFFSRLMR